MAEAVVGVVAVVVAEVGRLAEPAGAILVAAVVVPVAAVVAKGREKAVVGVVAEEERVPVVMVAVMVAAVDAQAIRAKHFPHLWLKPTPTP